MLVLDKYDFSAENPKDISYNFSMQNFVTIRFNSFLTRLKFALKYLFRNKPVYWTEKTVVQ
ncbi:hypothetical protein DRA42_11450 [Ethanoligenens harbinense]|nr:hypothetical protein CXQ68_11415 [Ethanoligenens harbinense YUAN-3]AYF39423.1 hypothetical protein CXP51_11310 [Ethanoligenens harbinense]AYF42247.1 hypothetical protein CN246_11855 [Ethanoligenens harbinense]QCN93003.1 hypothetical protein DRA42_11450 [Ethanoligenens harbinense]